MKNGILCLESLKETIEIGLKKGGRLNGKEIVFMKECGKEYNSHSKLPEQIVNPNSSHIHVLITVKKDEYDFEADVYYAFIPEYVKSISEENVIREITKNYPYHICYSCIISNAWELKVEFG